METKTEIWIDIEGYDGMYQVSNMGRVKSVARLTTRRHKTAGIRCYRIPEKIMKQRVNTAGYLCVNLHDENGKQVTMMVHRLVASAFIPNPQNLETVNHKDEDKTNNRADNLEWMTIKDNVNYGTGIERNSIIQSKRGVIMLTKDGSTELRRFRNTREAARYLGKERGDRNIALSCNHVYRHPTAYGYRWEWADK